MVLFVCFFLCQSEDKVINGGLGFSLYPVIQVAGAQRIIESDPRELFGSANFAVVPTMYLSY